MADVSPGATDTLERRYRRLLFTAPAVVGQIPGHVVLTGATLVLTGVVAGAIRDGPARCGRSGSLPWPPPVRRG